MSNTYSLDDLSELLNINKDKVKHILYRALKIKPIRFGIYSEESFLIIDNYLKEIEEKKRLRKEFNVVIKKVEVPVIVEVPVVVEVPRLITKEINYYIFQSKLNFLTLEQL